MANAATVEIGLALGATLLTAWGVGRMRRWSGAWGLLDIPNERSSHDRPLPRGGGLVIVVVVLTGLAAVAWLSSAWRPAVTGWLGAALVAAVGWRDDLRSLPVPVRLAAQGLAAALVVGSGVSSSWVFPGIGEVTLGWTAPVLSFLVLVGLTNAYNFMDGIDGIAGGQAVVAGLTWALAAGFLDCPLAGWAGALVAGASVGFLIHNWPPARIFMGDVGSGTLGFLFAWLAIRGGTCDSRLPIAGLAFVWPFIFDTVFTFLRRLRLRENVFQAHRSHLYQRLVTSGLPHARVSAIYVGLALIGILPALAWLRGWPGADLALFLLPSLGAVGLLLSVVARESRVSPPG